MNAATFRQIIHDAIPEEKRRCSGRVFFSPLCTIAPGDIYLLGINPGGVDGLDQSREAVRDSDTIQHDIEQFVVRERDGTRWNGAYDRENERWAGRSGGRMQNGVIDIAKSLGYNISNIPATNLIFARTKSVLTLGGELEEWANMCWPIHVRLMQEIRPRLLITYGGAAFDFIARRVGSEAQNLDRQRGGRNWCRAFVWNHHHNSDWQRTTVIGLPHVSRGWRLSKHQPVINWIKQLRDAQQPDHSS